jgi:hypothetical protein
MRVRWCRFHAGLLLLTIVFLHRPLGAETLTCHGFPIPAAAEAAVKIGKQTIEQVVGKDDNRAKKLGFTSAVDAADAGTLLGNPFRVIWVSLEKLKAFQPGITDPKDILEPIHEFIYPVMVRGDTVSSITVTETVTDPHDKPIWRATGWGAQIVRLMEAKRKKIPTANCVVQIPALNRYFLGDTSTGEFKMIVVNPVDPDTQPVPLPADNIFTELQPEAKAHEGGLR